MVHPTYFFTISSYKLSQEVLTVLGDLFFLLSFGGELDLEVWLLLFRSASAFSIRYTNASTKKATTTLSVNATAMAQKLIKKDRDHGVCVVTA